MYNITLICTTHKDIGECNSRELYKIMEELKPQIIFEELSPAIYNECYSTNSFGITKRLTLETSAIKMYLQNHIITHIPVVSVDTYKDFDGLLHEVTNYQSYRNLINNLELSERTDGFQFLNSKECEQLFEDIKSHEKLILSDEIFSKVYQPVDDYENDIIENVYNYSTENAYDRALMFIGAAHRKSIIQKVQDYNIKSALKLNWSFYRNQV